MTFSQQVTQKALVLKASNKTYRLGQAYFLALDSLFPQLSKTILDTNADPFYNDANLEHFFLWLNNVSVKDLK